MKLAKKKSLWLFRAHPFQSPNILDDSSSEPLQVSRSPSKSPAKDLKSSQSSFTVQLTELSSAALLNVGNLSPRPTIPDVEYHAATQTPLANVKNETTQSAQHSQTTLATPPQARDMQQEYWQLELDATRAIEDLQQKLAKEMAISKSLERENHQLRLQELDVRRVEQGLTC